MSSFIQWLLEGEPVTCYCGSVVLIHMYLALDLKRERKKAIRSNNKKGAASDFICSFGSQLPLSHWACCE